MPKQVVSIRLEESLIAKVDSKGKRGDVIAEALGFYFDGRKQESFGVEEVFQASTDHIQDLAEATVPAKSVGPSEEWLAQRIKQLKTIQGGPEYQLRARALEEYARRTQP